MPRRRYRKRSTYRRRPRRRRRRRRGSRLSICKIRQVSGMPDMLITKLRYQANFSNNSSQMYSKQFALNGLYDPDLTAVGHQPLGFDQFMAFYERYEVRGSSIACQITNNGTAEFQIILYPSTFNTAVSGSATAVEQPYSRSRMLGESTGSSRSYLKNYITCKKLLGRNIDSVNYTGSSSTNPSNVLYWYAQVFTTDGVSNADIQGKIILTYYVRFYKRLALGSS